MAALVPALLILAVLILRPASGEQGHRAQVAVTGSAMRSGSAACSAVRCAMRFVPAVKRCRRCCLAAVAATMAKPPVSCHSDFGFLHCWRRRGCPRLPWV
ncbi:hypothetical protein BJY52DRAFT_1257704 [Lactarius psammicola]|nr:hypothetical protein BJY52DRAFT_1257704 [Lactarius psammicola]